MKFLYNPDSLLNLLAYGIQIPLNDGRILKTLETLRQTELQVTVTREGIPLTREDFLSVHTEDFVAKLFGTPEERQKLIRETFELVAPDGSYHRYAPGSTSRHLEEIVGHVLRQTSLTVRAAAEALETGGAVYHLGGGYHHAMSFGGRGFCLVNDIVIAARWLQRHRSVKRIWIIDVDAHKGDGTAELTSGDDSIRTLSIHMKNGWPLDTPEFNDQGLRHPWFTPSDVDLGIVAGEEESYLPTLTQGLARLEEFGLPELAIVVQGSDPFEKDELPSSGHLRLDLAQMQKRDFLVFDFLKARKIPQAYVMAGGYGAFAHEPYCAFFEGLVQTGRL